MPSIDAIQSLGKYRIDEIVGRGAMGIVYKGYDGDIQRVVAVKVLHRHLLADALGEELALRFRQEAQAAARCMHANIVTVFDYGIREGAHFIVMEYIEGIDLKTLLKQETQLPYRQASDIIVQVLSALEYAHQHGVVHRDIKPANIMILHSGRVKVADFGVARLDNSDLTQAGFLIGTPSYMSPEGCRGKAVDSRSDLFSVGVVFFEILTGKRLGSDSRPDPAELKSELDARVQDPAIAAQLGELLLSALQEDPALRIQRAEEFSQRLGSILSPNHRHVPDTEELAATVLRTAECPSLSESLQGSGAESSLGTSVPPSVIDQIKQALVPYVGPMASIMIKKYIKECCTIDELLSALATHIPNHAEQTQFRTSLSASGLSAIAVAQRTPGEEAAGEHAGRGPALSSLPVSELRQISALLARHVGPLATRMVSRAQRNASDWETFCDRLAENIPGDRERAEFVSELHGIRRC